MKNLVKYGVGFLLFLVVLDGKSQFYVNGQDPASVHWQQLKTPSATIIFPKEAVELAQKYANLIQISQKAVSTHYFPKLRRVHIVMHTRGTVSNAMVSPTPFHANFYHTPDQVTYAQRWPKQLALHEYRHVVQMLKLRQGFTEGLHVAFGDQAIGIIIGGFLPFWFIEGDAVFCETINSKSGRGRSPEFVMDLKAQLAQKKVYSYDKAQYGSYRDYVPDHYTLGYQLVLQGFLEYGNEFWDQTLNQVARKPFTLVPFSTGIKRFAGTGKVGYYKKVIGDLQKQWKTDGDFPTNTGFIHQPNPADFTNYRFAFPLKSGEIVAEKMSMDDINRFVLIDTNGVETLLKTPGFDFMQALSGNDSLLVWNEKEFDPRWTNRDYSVIKIWNANTGKTHRLINKTSLFAPVLSHDATTIAAIRVDEQSHYLLQLIDSHDGYVVNEISTPENWFLTFPSWADDDKSLVMVALGDEGMAVIRVDVEQKKTEVLVPFGFTNISKPVLHHQNLVYKGAYDGTSNLYSLDLATGVTRKLTTSGYGVSDPAFSASGDSLYYVDYTADGYRIARLDLTKKIYQSVDLAEIQVSYPVDRLLSTDQFNLDDVNIPDSVYPVKKYSRLGHLFNFHSWGLTAIDLQNYSFSPGVNLLSQNLLSTSTAYAGYYYDRNEQTGKFKAGLDYMGWYPVISLTAETGRRKQNYLDNQHLVQEARWRETNLSVGISVPLNFTSSRWVKGIQPSVGITEKLLKMDQDVQVLFREDQVTSLNYGFYGYVQYKRSLRDLYPKWGQSLEVNFRHTPFSDSVSSELAISSVTYFQGIMKHHGIRIFTGYQMMENGNYSYGNLLSSSRGYTGISLTEMFVMKADYAFPVAYPDWDIPSVIYLKRISTHLFYDITSGQDFHHINQTFASTGIELYTDWHFLGLLPEITLGVRSSYRLDDQNTAFEMLFGFSF
ncbi:MAG: hypothetical protein CVT99_11085 [Bacteroidetes bacterium HGW-Bacteroidetes-16]|jgi:hypothetical protein|nr:MAG: hypothetical protein CVT99_11085 [Bacteroidetes bacterium HGW-Bacteroidetes-16]